MRFKSQKQTPDINFCQDSRKLKRERRRSTENQSGSPVFVKSDESIQQEYVSCQQFDVDEKVQVTEDQEDLEKEKNVCNASADPEMTIIHRKNMEFVMGKHRNK